MLSTRQCIVRRSRRISLCKSPSPSDESGQRFQVIAALHGRFAEKAEMLTNELKAKLSIAKFETLRISPVLGVHTGHGIVGAAVVPIELMEDLA